MTSIREKTAHIESIQKPLEYISQLFDLIKQLNAEGNRVHIDTNFFNVNIEKCLEAKGEAILPHMLELAKYFVALIKGKKQEEIEMSAQGKTQTDINREN